MRKQVGRQLPTRVGFITTGRQTSNLTLILTRLMYRPRRLPVGGGVFESRAMRNFLFLFFDI